MEKFLKSGVKNIFIIGLVPDVSEDYVNVKRLWMNCGVENLRNYTVATNLNLFNILLGMMSHSSCHPCALCDITKEAFLKNGNQWKSPELHLLIGPVNKMYAVIESLRSDSKNWLKSCNVKEEDYHGGSSASNESRKLLKSNDRLEAFSPPSSSTKFINAFKSFNQVV